MLSVGPRSWVGDFRSLVVGGFGRSVPQASDGWPLLVHAFGHLEVFGRSWLVISLRRLWFAASYV
jgi:hypothetical protein